MNTSHIRKYCSLTPIFRFLFAVRQYPTPSKWRRAGIVAWLTLFVLIPSVAAQAREVDAPAVELRHVRTLKNDQPITAIAWHPDGHRLAVGQVLDGRVFVWNVHAGRLVREINERSGTVHALAYSPDGKYLAVGRGFTARTHDHVHVHLYSASTGELVHRFTPPPTQPKGGSNDAQALAFSPDGKYLVASGYGADSTAAVYELPTGKVIATLPDSQTPRANINTLVFSPDGKFVAAGRTLGGLDIWSSKDWKLFKRLEGQGGGVHALTFSPDGKYLASGTNIGERWDRATKPARQKFGQFSDDVVLWSVPKFDNVSEFASRRFKQTPYSSIIDRLQFSPDSKLLLVGARSKSLEIIDIINGKVALFEDGLSSTAVSAFSPDGKLLAVGLGNKIDIYELTRR